MSASLATQTNLLQAVAALHSDAGVLSVYVDSRPERKMHGRPGWEISLRAGLAGESTGFATHHPDIAARIRAHIAALEPMVAELIDPADRAVGGRSSARSTARRSDRCGRSGRSRIASWWMSCRTWRR